MDSTPFIRWDLAPAGTTHIHLRNPHYCENGLPSSPSQWERITRVDSVLHRSLWDGNDWASYGIISEVGKNRYENPNAEMRWKVDNTIEESDDCFGESNQVLVYTLEMIISDWHPESEIAKEQAVKDLIAAIIDNNQKD